MKKYVDHRICEECNHVHKEAFFDRDRWTCPNTKYTVDRSRGRLGLHGQEFPCHMLRGHYLVTVVREEVCRSCSLYEKLHGGPAWYCVHPGNGAMVMTPWAKLPPDCLKKMEHCVAAAGDYDAENP